MSGRFLVAPALALLLLVIGATTFVAPSSQYGRSTLSREADGTAALGEILLARGREVDSLRLGLQVLRNASPQSVLVVLAGTSAFSLGHSPIEVERMVEIVESGGTVVLLSDRPHGLTTHVGINIAPRSRGRGDLANGLAAASPVVAHALTLGGSLQLQGRGALLNDVGLPLFASDGKVVAATVDVGLGRLVAFADPFVATNAGLTRGGNLMAMLSAIEGWLGPSGRVLFDDLHAGAPNDRGIVAYARRAGLAPALFLSLVTIGLFLWRGSRREGAVLVASRHGPTQPSTELVHALATLYERAGLTDHALDIVSRRFRREIEARSGVPWNGSRMRQWVLDELGPGAAKEFDDLSRRFAEAYRVSDPSIASVGELADRVHRFRSRRLIRRRAGPPRRRPT